jgi:Fusaric acid resistance protein family
MSQAGATGEARSLRFSAALLDATRAAGPPLLFGLRLWASVCLALYVAFWLELDNAYWAGTSAAIVCQPHLGASLRKGWFRMIGTVVGAVAIVVLTACFPRLRQVNMTISLAFLAPDLVQAAIEGRLPRGIGVTRLRDAPVEWSRQHAMLGLSL